MKRKLYLLAFVGLIGCVDSTEVPKQKYEDRPQNAVLHLSESSLQSRADGKLYDTKTQQPFSGQVKGDIPNSNTQRIEGKMVNGQWEGEYKAYDKTADGKEYLVLKRTYQSGKQVGSSWNYFPNGKAQAELRYENGKLVCAIHYDATGKTTLNTCK